MGELANAYKYLRISTHAPAGGATAAIIDWRYGVTFLLTPLREGRRGSRAGRGRRGSISTHAPAGGATALPSTPVPVAMLISTHAPAGGATKISFGRSRLLLFLLTPLREGRRLFP